VNSCVENIFENEKMKKYLYFIEIWKDKINLISKESDLLSIQDHIKDCSEILNLIPNHSTILDIGTGAGFPGVVISILKPDCIVHLSDINQKKTTFLKHIVKNLGLNAVVETGCVTQVQKSFPVIVSRAVCSVKKLLEFVSIIHKGDIPRETLCIFLKGDNLENEIKEAEISFSFQYDTVKGITYKNRNFFLVRNIQSRE
jgi:16S rRNA (guanine527-N7)-methyltransferase